MSRFEAGRKRVGTSARDALARAHEDSLEAIAIDRSVTPLDELLLLVRTLRDIRPGAVIVVTSRAHLLAGEIVACFEAGVDECVQSPFHPSELAARVQRFARRDSVLLSA